MENPGVYISQLLTEHDCVIVPDFGGFIARPVSAHFSKGGNMLLSPGKSLVFNQKLDNSDGLLAHHVAKTLGINYREASQQIDAWVTDAKRKLETNRRLELEHTGVLYYSAENQLLFEPASTSNHQVSSFGLPAVHAVEISVLETKVSFEEPKVYRTTTVHAGRARVVRVATIASSVVVIALLAILGSQTPSVRRALASLNPLDKKETAYHMQPYGLGNSFASKMSKASSQLAENKIEIPEITNRTFVINPDTVHTDKTRVHKLANFTASSNNYNAPFQIVVGCFAIEQNAHKLIHQLERDGVSAGISGQNAKGLYVVSVAGFTTESLARTKLQQVQQRFPSAWILVK